MRHAQAHSRGSGLISFEVVDHRRSHILYTRISGLEVGSCSRDDAQCTEWFSQSTRVLSYEQRFDVAPDPCVLFYGVGTGRCLSHECQ